MIGDVTLPLKGNYRLAVRPKPFVGESPRGYLIRLSSANGYPTPTWLLKKYLGHNRVLTQDDLLQVLEQLTGHPEVSTILAASGSVYHLPYNLKSKFSRICPECVKERGGIEAVWDVAYSCACPLHGLFLIDACPRCNLPISWDRNRIDHCSCGGALFGGRHHEAPQDIIFLNEKIWSAAGYTVKPVPNFPNHELSVLPLESLCLFYRFLIQCENNVSDKTCGYVANVAAQLCNILPSITGRQSQRLAELIEWHIIMNTANSEYMC